VLDPFAELAFLGMECAFLGAPWFGPKLIKTVAEGLGEKPPKELLRLYGALGAVTRARLSIAHLLDPNPRRRRKWVARARGYLDLAELALRAAPDRDQIISDPKG
jgi:aminoglycoside phosphotransferase family enzyme